MRQKFNAVVLAKQTFIEEYEDYMTHVLLYSPSNILRLRILFS